MNAQLGKRRRNDPNPQDDTDNFDLDGSAQGAKHWTDDEKTRLFEWLMGPGQEEHWNALRATKNSCLREVCRLCQKQIKSFLTFFPKVCQPSFWRKEDLPGSERLL
jgi:histone acetyltransferase MYST4